MANHKCKCGKELSTNKTKTGLCRKCFLSQAKGKNAMNWQGGKKKNNGYVMIYNPKHKYSDQQGYVREHRLVMEKHIGRYLEKHEVVHHKNGARNDNRIENLELLSKIDHDRHHTKGENNPFYGKTHTKKTRQKLSKIGSSRKIKRDENGRILGWT